MEFRKDFNDRPRLVVLNKCDLNPQIDKISRDFEIETGIKPFTISAKHGFKIGELLMELKKIISIMNESERKKLLTDIENEKQEQIKRILLDKEFFEKS